MNDANAASAASHEGDPEIAFDVPAMRCGVAPRINPHYPVIRANHATWVYRHLPAAEPGQLPRGISDLDAGWNALIFPDGLAERVCHHACVTTLNIDVDDRARAVSALFEPSSSCSDTSWESTAIDLWKTVKAHAPSEGAYQRLRSAWHGSGSANQDEFAPLESAAPLDVETAGRLCHAAASVRPYYAALEYVLDLDVGDIHKHPDIAVARERGVTHILLHNDLYSYSGEPVRRDDANVLAMLCRTHGYRPQQAADQMFARLVGLDVEISEAVNRLHMRYADHPLGTRLHVYIDAHAAIVAGSVQWHLETPRYVRPGYTWDGRLTRQVRAGASPPAAHSAERVVRAGAREEEGAHDVHP